MIKPMTDPEFPWTGNLSRRADPRILGIGATRPGDRAALLSGEGSGPPAGGTIFAGFLKVLPVFVLVLPGMIARALYPQLFTMANGHVDQRRHRVSDADRNPAARGLVGLMIAALLAALMGSMSAVFNSASTMVTLDSTSPESRAPPKRSS